MPSNGDKFRKVIPGDPISGNLSAEAWNAMLDRARPRAGRSPSANELSDARILMGKLVQQVSTGVAGSMAIWNRSFKDDGTFVDQDTGATVIVHDWLLGSNQAIAVGSKVIVVFVGGLWQVVGAQCS